MNRHRPARAGLNSLAMTAVARSSWSRVAASYAASTSSNICAFGLAAGSDMLVFRVAAGGWAAETFAAWPLVEAVAAGAHIMIRGGGFHALQEWLLEKVARSVRSAEMTMVIRPRLHGGRHPVIGKLFANWRVRTTRPAFDILT